MRCSLAVTPHGEQAREFPYYCPLCMEHYADVLVTPCCSNYTCVQCVLGYLDSRQLSSAATGAAASGSINVALALLQRWSQPIHVAGRKSEPEQPVLRCPQCTQPGFCPVKVVLGSCVRSYSCSPKANGEARAALFVDSEDDPVSAFLGTPRRQGHGQAPISPVRVGASFTELKRKMRQFQAQKATPRGLGSDSSSGGEVEAAVVTMASLPLATPALIRRSNARTGGAEVAVRDWLTAAVQGRVWAQQQVQQKQHQGLAQGLVERCVAQAAQRLLSSTTSTSQQ